MESGLTYALNALASFRNPKIFVTVDKCLSNDARHRNDARVMDIILYMLQTCQLAFLNQAPPFPTTPGNCPTSPEICPIFPTRSPARPLFGYNQLSALPPGASRQDRSVQKTRAAQSEPPQ